MANLEEVREFLANITPSSKLWQHCIKHGSTERSLKQPSLCDYPDCTSCRDYETALKEKNDGKS